MFQQPCSYSHLWIKAPWFIEGWNVNVCIAHHSHSLDPLSHLTSIAQPFSPSFRHRKQLLKDTWTFRLNEICYILELLNNRLVSAQTPVPGLYSMMALFPLKCRMWNTETTPPPHMKANTENCTCLPAWEPCHIIQSWSVKHFPVSLSAKSILPFSVCPSILLLKRRLFAK